MTNKKISSVATELLDPLRRVGSADYYRRGMLLVRYTLGLLFCAMFLSFPGQAVSGDPGTSSISLEKTANSATYTLGDTIIYTFVVRNWSNATLTGVMISDPLPGLSPITWQSNLRFPGPPGSLVQEPSPQGTLVAGESATFTATLVVTQAHADAGSIRNTATATGTPPVGEPLVDEDTLWVPVLPSFGILLEKTADVTEYTEVGDVITYSFTVTNTGSLELFPVSVDDPLPGLSQISPASNDPLMPGQQRVFTATYEITQADLQAGQVVNTATATGYTKYEIVSDEDTVTVSFNPIVEIIKRAISPIYEVYPSFLLDQLRLPRLQERVGNRHWVRPAAGPEAVVAAAESEYVFCKDPAQNFRCEVTPEQAEVYANPLFGSFGTDTGTVIEGQGFWVRADGMLSRYTPVESTTGAGYTARAAGIQIGYDHVLSEGERGRLIGGVNLSYRTATADVTSDAGLGEIATAGYGLGASLTWYAQNGFYIDAQGQAVWLESDLSAEGLGLFATGHKTEGYGLSLEMGREIALSEAWALTPQAQLSYATVRENGFTDALGTLVSFHAESLQLHLGVEVSNEESWQAEDGTTSRRSLRVGAHVIHEFKPETTVVVGGTPLRSKRDATMAEITLGGTYNWSDDRNSFYAQIGASTGLENFGDSHRLRGTIGFRRQWE